MPERFGEIETQRPMLKDLIIVDGRWGQYLAKDRVKFLDTGELEDVNLDQYRLARKTDQSFKNFIESGSEKNLPTEEEVEKITGAGTPLGQLTVYGEYEKLPEQ